MKRETTAADQVDDASQSSGATGHFQSYLGLQTKRDNASDVGQVQLLKAGVVGDVEENRARINGHSLYSGDGVFWGKEPSHVS